MADIRPFAALRPRKDIASAVAALPYDVYSRKEAKEEVSGKPLSFLCIDRAETGLPDEVDTYAPEVYARARSLFEKMIEDGNFVSDDKPCYYIYELTMDGRTQSGIVAVSAVDDYLSGTIKKHENTRADKEQDRINHVDTLSAQTGPIFLAYRAQREIDAIVDRVRAGVPENDFTSDDGIGHRVWIVDSTEDIEKLRDLFAKTDSIYIADGHHRAASAVKVGVKRRDAHPGYTGEEEFNYFLSVLFPDEQLAILPYNRVVRDLNGLTADAFFDAVGQHFTIEKENAPVAPGKKGTFGLFLDNCWYRLTAKEEILSDDPVKGLDVSILQDYLLAPILGIADPRTDSRIDFVGGIRGLSELEKRATTDMKLAFSMYPTSIEELFDVADAGLLMPPKSTWFEPKLRSGLFIHQIER